MLNDKIDVEKMKKPEKANVIEGKDERSVIVMKKPEKANVIEGKDERSVIDAVKMKATSNKMEDDLGENKNKSIEIEDDLKTSGGRSNKTEVVRSTRGRHILQKRDITSFRQKEEARMSRMAREKSVEDLNKTWTFNAIEDHDTIDLNLDEGLKEQEEDAMDEELNRMKARNGTKARLEKRERNREKEWENREWDLDLSLNSDVEEEAEFHKQLEELRRDNMTLRRVKKQERMKERAAIKSKDGRRCKAKIDMRATAYKMKDLRRKRLVTWTRRVVKARKPARWPCGYRYCGDKNCGQFSNEMKTKGEIKKKEEEKEETEDDGSSFEGAGEEAGGRGGRWTSRPERAARAKLRELAARRLQKLRARSQRSIREKREAKMAENNKETWGEKEKEEKDDEEWDDEDEEEAKALKKSLDEEKELKKELARLKEEAKAYKRQAEMDRKKIKEQEDIYRSLCKMAKGMGMKVEEFEGTEKEMEEEMRKDAAKKKGKEEKKKKGGKKE